jgi:hypothetical protein
MTQYLFPILFAFALFYLLIGAVVGFTAINSLEKRDFGNRSRVVRFIALVAVFFFVAFSWPAWVGAFLSRFI